MKRNRSDSVKDKTLIIAKAALDQKAENVVIMKMKEVTTICDFFIICSANTERKIKAIANNIIKELKNISLKVWHIEGYNEASWILLDCYDVVVHIFREDLREFYNLEHLWAGLPKRVITEESVKKLRKGIHTTN